MFLTRTFKTLATPSVYTYEEKRSRFIAHIWPVSSKDQVFDHYEKSKLRFPDARHHCWAYIIGDPEQAQSAGFNDDGEPGGTAGKPMLNVLTQRKVGNVFSVVVRYFGGIKLGAGGLTRAYGQSISGALDIAQWTEVIPKVDITVSAEYALEDRLRHILNRFDVEGLNTEYGQKALLTGTCPLHMFDQLKAEVQQQSSGQATCVKTTDLD